MLRNYFKTAWRNLAKNKVYTLLNVLGLATGISAALIIYLIINYDFSFDKFEKDGDRIYRIVSDYSFSGQSYHSPGVPHAMPDAVRHSVTGLDLVAPFRVWNDGVKVSIPQEKNNELIIFKKQMNIAFVDENYFKLLPYQWMQGSAKTSLQQPYEVVLTEADARLYFPKLSSEQVTGKEVIFNDTIRTIVTGVVKNLGHNTDFSFQSFISRATIETPRLKPQDGDEWGSTNSASQLFVKLSPGTTAAQIENQVAAIFKANYHATDQTANITTTHGLQPLSDLHFNTAYGNFDQRLAHKPTLYGLLAIAVFLLLLGCINFINLTTAQSSQRAKETGIRKTMGSSRKQLLLQFLTETFLLTFTATALSLCLTPLLFKAFSNFIPTGLHLDLFNRPGIILFLLLLVISVSLLSGFYPAFVLSGFKPVNALKRNVFANTGKPDASWLRRSLTVFQFVIAQVFIIATILVSSQIRYTLNKDLGFKKDAVLYFNTNYNDPDYRSDTRLLKSKLENIPGIAMVSLANSAPSSTGSGTRILTYRDGKNAIETEADKKFVDTNYIRLYQMKLVAGTNLPYSDTIHNLIINETYAHALGFRNPQQAIGKFLDWGGNLLCPVVGVVADFHQKSLHEPIKPLVLSSRVEEELMVSIALQPMNEQGTSWKTTIGKIKAAFNEVYPGDDFEYNFLDDSIAKYYIAEENTSQLLMWATGLSIFISCLGLLGLVIYITNQRTKEIGIRKVVGATVAQIIFLLSKDFLKPVIIAFVIAIPVAWLGSNKWLENFAYKVSLSWWIFFSGGCIMFLIAFVILFLRTFRAATANPVENLRTE
ncbi:MAG TPA: ABC transporter permease [Parafilimonas sp.]|nr:ABC transporter permease [Parafilimonas sp.]